LNVVVVGPRLNSKVLWLNGNYRRDIDAPTKCLKNLSVKQEHIKLNIVRALILYHSTVLLALPPHFAVCSAVP